MGQFKKKCDGHYPTKVLDIGGGVYAGSKWESKGYYSNFPVILNCSGDAISLPKHRIPFDWGKSFETLQTKEILLEWANNCAPSINHEFWTVLRDFIVDNQKPILVLCLGGHGRTGTAIVSLMLATGLWKTEDAINALRKEYCEEAVETKVQVNYLYSLEKYLKGDE
jgi:hypothetical protein